MNVIFACDKNYGIGIDNKLPPWKIKGDLARFSKLTIGDGNNVVIMGKNTYLSLPNQYLKNRQNVVVSNILKLHIVFTIKLFFYQVFPRRIIMRYIMYQIIIHLALLVKFGQSVVH